MGVGWGEPVNDLQGTCNCRCGRHRERDNHQNGFPRVHAELLAVRAGFLREIACRDEGLRLCRLLTALPVLAGALGNRVSGRPGVDLRGRPGQYHVRIVHFGAPPSTLDKVAKPAPARNRRSPRVADRDAGR
jgi:hypothetical protein